MVGIVIHLPSRSTSVAVAWASLQQCVSSLALNTFTSSKSYIKSTVLSLSFARSKLFIDPVFELIALLVLELIERVWVRWAEWADLDLLSWPRLRSESLRKTARCLMARSSYLRVSWSRIVRHWLFEEIVVLEGVCRSQHSTCWRVSRHGLDVTEDALGDDWLALELFFCLVKESIVIELVIIGHMALTIAAIHHLCLVISSVYLHHLVRLQSFEVNIRLLAVIEATLLRVSHLLVPRWCSCDLAFGQSNHRHAQWLLLLLIYGNLIQFRLLVVALLFDPNYCEARKLYIFGSHMSTIPW